jgi:hypothetical protein
MPLQGRVPSAGFASATPNDRAEAALCAVSGSSMETFRRRWASCADAGGGEGTKPGRVILRCRIVAVHEIGGLGS